MLSTPIVIVIVAVILLILIVLGYYFGWFSAIRTILTGGTASNGSTSDIVALSQQIRCPECPKTLDINGQISGDNEMLKLMVKYLTLVIRKNDAEKELFKLEKGHHQVFHSPRIDQINNQLALFKGQIIGDPRKLQYFQENLDLMV